MTLCSPDVIIATFNRSDYLQQIIDQSYPANLAEERF